jgi:hypothetical protein
VSAAGVGGRIAGAWRRVRPKTWLAWVHVASGVLCALGLLAAIAYVFRPVFLDPTTFGSHDWDQVETHRFLVTKTILRFHQFPFWNPYACGGHPAWGGFESDPIVVSPWLPAYLLAPFPLALRIEVAGSTLLGAAGAWLLASRFTGSRALRALVAALFVLNSRWTMQIAVGHVWHTAYAWMPWVLYFYDRAAGAAPLLEGPRKRDGVLAAVCLAMLVYTGGIYPLPHTAVALVAYAALLAVTTRSLVPVWRMMACGLLGLGLAAPRLLPIIEVLRRFPRLIDSTETMDWAAFVEMLTSKQQEPTSMPTHVPQWGWHEWGMYVGWGALVAIALGALLSRGTRERPLMLVGLAMLVLAFGRFDEDAPWALLHLLPVFSSQHVPSRWMLPALLLLACAAASTGERVLARSGRARGLLEVGVMLVAAWLVRDVCMVVRASLTHAFGRAAPHVTDPMAEFRTLPHVPPELAYDPGEWAPSTLSAVMANIGSLDCNTFPGFNNYTRGQSGRAPGMGAHAAGDPEYRGEAFVAERHGTARIVAWSPNAMDVEVEGALPGDHVVLDQNWDPGWTANGERSVAWSDSVAGVVTADPQSFHFRYRPRTLWLGVALFFLAAAAPAARPLALGLRRWRRRRRRPRPSMRETGPSPAPP